MNGNKVSFDEGEYTSGDIYRQNKQSKISQFLINNSGGLVKDERGAKKVLLILAILGFILTFVLLTRSTSDNVSNEIIISPDETVGSPQGVPQ